VQQENGENFTAALPMTAIGGKTLDEWETQWRPLGLLTDDPQTFPITVGVYRLRSIHDGNTLIYIGRATESHNGGFRKRLRDYTRENGSARGSKSGQYINANARKLSVEIIVTGNDENAEAMAVSLEFALIRRYRPQFNSHGAKARKAKSRLIENA
jgi:excinuclease UvrABC nuclease subunit